MKKYKVQGKLLTKKQWLEKVKQHLESILKYDDEIWSDDNCKNHVYYTLEVEED